LRLAALWRPIRQRERPVSANRFVLDPNRFRALLADRTMFKQQLVNSCQQSLGKSEIDT